MTNTKNRDQQEIMVVNDTPGEECRIAILQNAHLEELYTERVATASNVGNIYKGRIVNVEAAIQAAFIDFGLEKNGFLHISDLHPRYFPGGDLKEHVGKKIPRRQRPLIQQALKRGQEVLVQVLKEGMGTKGPTLTSYLSVPGRMLVMMPEMDRVGVSRKIEDEEKRREMRQILDSLDLPEGFGFILRTAGFERNKTELKRDVQYLTRLWKVMDKRIASAGAPCELYTESDLFIRTIRDVVRPTISTIIVDSLSAYERAQAFLKVVAPRSAPKLLHYRRPVPIFHAFDIERQIELIHARTVPLPSGGAIVIDQTEALVAIDVNSGRSRSARDSETNAFQTNCEAVDEICRQIRLRDLGGLIVNDIIDMRQHKNRRAVEERMRNNLKRDRAKTTALRLSEFSILEMTRQRMRPSLRMSHYQACPHCQGNGEVRSPEYVGSDATRQMGFLLQHDRVHRVEMVCSPRVASVLLSSRRRELVTLEEATGKSIDVRVSETIAADRVNFFLFDDRNMDVSLEDLPEIKPPDINQLEAAMAPPDEKPETGRRRRSRRRKAPPADATTIALDGEGDASETTDDQPEPASRRSKRRKKKKTGRAASAPKVSDDTEEAPPELEGETPVAEPPPPTTPEGKTRIHLLARKLGVKSKEILERCAADDRFEVKNHMSTVEGVAVTVIRGWFTKAEPETPADGGGRRTRRGRRGGRRRGHRSEEKSGTEVVVETKDAEPLEAENAEAKPKRRRKRTSRKSVSQNKPEAAKTPVVTDDVTDATATEPKRKKKTTRRRRKGKSTEPVASDAPAAAEPTATESNSKAEPKAKPRTRRRLYGSRVGVSAAAREQAEQATGVE